jgi:hypothetical protein
MHRVLLPLLLVFASGLPLAAQFKTTTIPTSKLTHKHFVFFKCEGQPDKVMGRRDERYFGCVNGKVACSDDGVSSSMIAAYESRRDQIRSGARRQKQEFDARHASRHPGSSSRRSSRRSSTVSAPIHIVQSTPRPPAQAEPIEADKVRQVTVGTSIDEVISMLGQPKWRIAGSTESWKYSLTSGKTAKLVFQAGKVSSIAVP